MTQPNRQQRRHPTPVPPPDAIQQAMFNAKIKDATGRPSGYICPRCGNRPFQAFQQPQPGQFMLLQDKDGTPIPTSMTATWVESEDGQLVRKQALFCVNCVNQLEAQERVNKWRENLRPLLTEAEFERFPKPGTVISEEEANALKALGVRTVGVVAQVVEAPVDAAD